MVLYPAKNKDIYGIAPYQKFLMSCYITFKKKLQHVGHIWIVLWVSGLNGSTHVTHFQPWYQISTIFLLAITLSHAVLMTG